MKLSRRSLIKSGIGGSVVGFGSSMPWFLARQATAIENKATDTDRVLVVVELDGGNDGLNTVVPYGDDIYYKQRPALAIKVNKLTKLDDHLALNGNMRSLRKHWDADRMCVVQGVGYPNPSRSHFVSASIWQAARLDASNSTQGWLSRVVDLSETDRRMLPRAIQLSPGSLAQALKGGANHAATLDVLDRWQKEANRNRATLNEIESMEDGFAANNSTANGLASRVGELMKSQFLSTQKLNAILRHDSRSTAQYPDTDFARQLRAISELLRLSVSTRIYYVRLGNFDTHSHQAESHAQLLAEFADGVAAFMDDLESVGARDRVCIFAYSEFGRRVRENFQAGTDHGAAGPVFLFGPHFSTRLHGDAPNLSDLDDGDIRYSIDFRSVYVSLLHQWLTIEPSLILGEPFPQICLS